ncbi:MAG: hypothetical protein WA691_04195 [Thermoplasmata archaeon]
MRRQFVSGIVALILVASVAFLIAVPAPSTPPSAIPTLSHLQPDSGGAPTIAVTPTLGPEGSTFNVTGAGFTASSGANVSFDSSVLAPFGGSDCTHSGTNITTNSTGGFACLFTVPTISPGSYGVNATDQSTTNESNTVSFQVTALTIVVSPLQGPVGSSVTVTGSGFTVSSPAKVSFSSVVLTPKSSGDCVVSGTTITTDPSGGFACTFTVPTSTPGAHDINATDLATSNSTAPSTFTVTTLLIGTTPSQGPVGSTFTVTGSGFTVSSGAEVSFDATALAPTGGADCPATATTITTDPSGAFSCRFTVPSVSTGSHNIVGTDLATSHSASPVSFTVTAVGITVSPQQGPQGATVTVSGSGFSVDTTLASLVVAAVTITSCPTAGSLMSNGTGAFSCAFSAPSGTSGTTVTATDVGGSVATGTFAVTSLAISVLPAQGPEGEAVSVSGTGFSVSSTLRSVVFDGVTETICAGGGSMTTDSAGAFLCAFTVPGGTSGTTVAVTDSGGEFATATFAVTVPAITVQPGEGGIGSTVSVNGQGFSVSAGLESLVFDGITISTCTGGGSLTTDSSGAFSCTFPVPSGASGTTVIATDVGGESGTGTFTVTTPAITVAPGQGAVGSAFTVTGSEFTANSGATVTFDGSALTPAGGSDCTFTGTTIRTDSSGAFSCTFSVPLEAGGSATVLVTEGTNQASREFVVTPSLAISIPSGTVGAKVNVSGNGFVPATAFTVFWNASTTLCSGNSSATGGFSCPFVIPATPAGSNTLSAVQGTLTVNSAFTVIPSAGIAPNTGPVGSTVAITGTGFDAMTRYTVSWNASVELCAGTTSPVGGFFCTAVVPASNPGAISLTVSEGTHTPTFSFTVTPSAPPTPASAAAPFPWWEVAVVVVLLGVVLAAVLVFGLRRRRRPRGRPGPRSHSGSSVAAWQSTPPPPSGSSSPPAAAGTLPVPPPPGVSGAEHVGEPEDIDVLISRLEKMSVQMFKKTPKELGHPDPAGETSGEPSNEP